jgi:hypothetical protein
MVLRGDLLAKALVCYLDRSYVLPLREPGSEVSRGEKYDRCKGGCPQYAIPGGPHAERSRGDIIRGERVL